jgi:DNA polymerase-1
MTTGSLQHKLSMTFAEAQKLTNDYWTTFPRIRPWLRERMFECRDFGYVTYWSGRRWYEEVENFYYRGANAVIQGGSADILSVAALRCNKWIKEQSFEAHIVSFIHDELLFEVAEEQVEYCADKLSEIMTVPDILGLPMKTEAKFGNTYGDLVDMRKLDGHWTKVEKSEVY